MLHVGAGMKKSIATGPARADAAGTGWEKIAKTPAVKALIRAYTAEVNRRAENKMLLTGKLEGSHASSTPNSG